MAQDVPPTCDVKVHELMKVQARLEGQRELEMAERIILKPDSTLEYSCFKQIAEGWQSGARSFSKPAGNNDINGLVLSPLSPYLQNFGHLFLGGTYEAEGQTYAQQLTKSDGQCNTHYWIWHLAKCSNPNPVHFFKLSQLLNSDYRIYPEACSGTLKTERDKKITADQELVKSFPDATKNPPFGVDNASKVTGKSDGDLYKTRLTTCGAPVKTGVKVKPLAGGGNPVDDAVCITPGCNYNGVNTCSR